MGNAAMPRPKAGTARHGQHTLSNAKLVVSEQLMATPITPLPGGTVTNDTNNTPTRRNSY